MVHSEVYLNKYVVSIAPFSTPAVTPTPIQKTALCCMFPLFNFSSIFQLTPFARMCIRSTVEELCGVDLAWEVSLEFRDTAAPVGGSLFADKFNVEERSLSGSVQMTGRRATHDPRRHVRHQVLRMNSNK